MIHVTKGPAILPSRFNWQQECSAQCAKRIRPGRAWLHLNNPRQRLVRRLDVGRIPTVQAEGIRTSAHGRHGMGQDLSQRLTLLFRHNLLRFSVVAPKPWAGGLIVGRLWTTPKALWKLGWFLRDFGYDADLIDRDELDDKRLVGLCGVVKISHSTVNGRPFTNLEAFAPAETWDEVPALPPAPAVKARRRGKAAS